MRRLIIILFVFSALHSMAQKTDTIWYNNKWEVTTKISDRYYSRIIQKIEAGGYLVADYYENGKLQMKGVYSSISPEIKNGAFDYWYRDGHKQMEVTYTDGKEVQVREFNPAGEITNEWELIPVVRNENGKLIKDLAVIQRSPKFPGGKDALADFIKDKLVYPKKEPGLAGKVVVQFMVSENGDILHPQIVSGFSPKYDQEAVRVVEKMPKWEPGMQNGKAVVITMTLPIVFN